MSLRRGIAIVLVLLALATFVSLAGILALYLALSREPVVAARSTLVVRLSGDLAEGADGTLGPFLPGSRQPGVRAIVDSLRQAKRDARVTALLVIPAGLASPYWGRIQEVRDAVTDFRRSGKATFAFVEFGAQRDYYLATACEHISLLPSSPLDLKGLASYDLFLRGTLDKIGAYPDLHHIGAYKTAINQFTEEGFTPAHREMAESLNNSLYRQLVRAVADGRRKSEAEVEGLINEGPFLPEDALQAGLVDDLAYEDQVVAKLPGGNRGARMALADYVKVSPTAWPRRGGRLALLYATGVIASGRSGYDPLNGPVVGSETLAESIRRIKGDDSIRAIVLRVDSPGGSAVASDVIWRELMVARTGTPSKPIVVSMSDLAASGGYYIAMAAPTIVAQPGTLTGSIGIFGGKIVTGGTYRKLGANVDGVFAGRHAGMDSPVAAYGPEEAAKLEEQLQVFYDQFVEKVARSRHLTPERVDAIAQGRVWTGEQAKEIGLVDALGGVQEAILLAKQAAKIPADQEVEIVVYPPRRTLYDLLSTEFSTGGEESRLRALAALVGRETLAGLAPMLLFRRGEPLALMPGPGPLP